MNIYFPLNVKCQKIHNEIIFKEKFKNSNIKI